MLHRFEVVHHRLVEAAEVDKAFGVVQPEADRLHQITLGLQFHNTTTENKLRVLVSKDL